VPVPSGTLTADATQVAVVDGDTLRLRDTVIRLEGITAPARGRTCRTAADVGVDCGAAATQALAGLVRDRTVSCHLEGRDSAGFLQAQCEAGGTALNEALVAAGFARARPDAPALSAEENIARSQHRGLWREAAGNGVF
jgi:endonuclease YncB( thermonuclease family)